jgi:type I restriction enzyme, S subunit
LSDELPEGWASVMLSEVTETVKSVNPKLSPDKRFSYVDISSIDNNRNSVTLSEVKDFAGADAPSRAKRPIQPDDTVFSNVRTYLKNIAMVPKGHRLDLCSTGFTILRPTAAIDPGYLFRYALTERFIDSTTETQTGTHYPATTDKLVRQQHLPLPPLPEQRRIVEKVEALLAQVDAARDRVERVPAILKRFRQSVLAAACTGRLTEDWREANPQQSFGTTLEEVSQLPRTARLRRGVPDHVPPSEVVGGVTLPDGWAKISVAELLRAGALVDVKDGNHGANHPKVSEFTEAGLPFITAAQVTSDGIDYEGAPKVSGVALDRLKVGFAEVDDVVLTHKGTVGRVAVSTRECVLAPQTTYYRCNLHAIDPDYLACFLWSLHYYAQAAHVMSQTTRDFVPISEQYNLYLFLPPPDEQVEIARQVKHSLQLHSQVERRVPVATGRTKLISESVLARAFRGNLVPTEADLAKQEGRDYETAAELLERVKRESLPTDGNGARKTKRRA